MPVQSQPTRVRILAVDDEADTLDVYRQALCAHSGTDDSSELAGLQARLFGESPRPARDAAFDVTLCGQGDAAVQLVREGLRAGRPFAVVFLDVRMPPGPDGIWAAGQIRGLDPNVEIVIVTAYSDRSQEEIAAAVPPPHKLLYLKKPVHLDEIRQFAAALGSKWEQERLLLEARRDLETHVEELRRAHETLQRSQEQLLYDAYHDSLTGLGNRSFFLDRLRWAVEKSRRREEYLFAALYLDLDRFKVINDSLGHAVGDRFLVAVGSRILRHLRSTDTCARLGGDEFTILLDDVTDVAAATRVAGRILEDLKRPIRVEGHDVFTSASIGIVTGGGQQSAEEIVRDADIALYRAKAHGRSRYEVFDAEMGKSIHARLQTEADLRRAVERRELVLHYQPITSLRSGRISGFEALVRWQHPERGLVPPGEFIPIAEEAGLIVPIEEWVLNEACAQLRAWSRIPGRPTPTVSVNVSSRHFMRQDLGDWIESALSSAGVDGSRLKIEITESTLIGDLDSAVQTLSRLRALAIDVQIDDFGTGYSSLSYLHRLPLTALKVDRSFVSRVCTDQSSKAIVQTIILLARALGLELVAEGIETAEQLGQLREMECDYGQGYYFHRPLPAAEATRLLHGS